MLGPRKEKICLTCLYYEPETENMEGECRADEDIDSSSWCETYENKGGKSYE